jgi:uncharacterized protein YndB with AHSA1/START domain
MPLDSLRVVAEIPATAAEVYAAWLDTVEHGLMTGAQAAIDARVGGRHSAWGDYIEGTNLELEPGRRIVQSWRTTEFSGQDADSRLEVRFADVPGGCEVTIEHTEIPEGRGSQYQEGWRTHYFAPMTLHFGGAAKKDATPPKEPAKKAVKAAAPKKAKKAARKAAPKKVAKKTARTAAPKKVAKKAARAAAPKKPRKAKKAARKIALEKTTKKAAKKEEKKAARKAEKKKKKKAEKKKKKNGAKRR